jgi:cation transport ATPase
MKYQAEIAHHVCGRIRMKIPAAKGNEVLLEQIKRALSPIPGVHCIEVNPSTGSVIMHYDPEVHEEMQLALSAHTKDHFELPRRRPATEIDELENQIEEEAAYLAEHSEAARAIVDFCKVLDREVKLATNNAVDLKVLVPLGLAVYTFLEIGVEAATPVWLTLGLFALNHFVEMHAHPAAPAQRGPEPAF